MEAPRLFGSAPYADARCIGMPRALLYHRHGTLWTTFLQAIGREVIVSDPTDRAVVEHGDSISNDECCLASKIYLGHVASLVGKCDAVFVPSIVNVGHFRGFCTKFQALPDLVSNTFANGDVRVVSCLVNETEEHQGMREGMLELASKFGVGSKTAKQAWKAALHAQEQAERTAAAAQESKLKTLSSSHSAPHSPNGTNGAHSSSNSSNAPVGILLAAHPYLSRDPYMGGALETMLSDMGAITLFTDETPRKKALAKSFEFSSTLPWIVNREIIGSIMMLHEKVDGIVLVSAFPCGPDSMTDDAVMRCIQGKPILNLTIDAQSGTAGLETRVESFIDILRYQKKGGYVHA